MNIDKIKDGVSKVAKRHNIKKVELFGSYAEGKNTRKSDVDLLVDFDDPSMSLFKLFEVQREFEKQLRKKVDVIATPISKDSFVIINKVVPIYG